MTSKKRVMYQVSCIMGLVILMFFLITGHFLIPSIFAKDPIEELQDNIDKLNAERELSIKATKPLEGQLASLERQLIQIQASIKKLSLDIKEKEKNLNLREDKLALQQALLEARVKAYYIRSYTNDPFIVLLSSLKSSELFRELSYQQTVAREDRQIIKSITQEVVDLLTEKEKLEKDKIRLAGLQVEVDKNANFLEGEIGKAKDFQADLSSKIAELSAKQQEILSARSGQFTASIGDSELADDYNASIKGFRESAPSGSFAVFSFGAYTHRKGMSQYGARGRAQSGQDYKTILKSYFGKEPTKLDTGGNIKVFGQGEMDFESKYLYGIAEMPSSWHKEALKAQAVAARTYAYRYKNDGKEICVSEACQVFSRSKSDNVPDAWREAVDETRGEIIEDVVTYYASTHGGFASPIGWDTTDGSGGGNFVDKAYDKLGGSPWLYKSWYTQGYSPSSDKCGRSNPWLSSEELADIINAARYRDDRVTPISSCWGGNPYTREELRAKSNGPANVDSTTVIQGDGSTTEVIFQTNIGQIKLSGSEFKQAFNLRAPGRLSIPQSGFAFFNIEKK